MGYIVKSGMGGFLNPPNDAEHVFSYHEGPRNNPSCCMSLRAALKESWVSDSSKERIKEILDQHQPQFTAEWEKKVYAYFHSCYSPDGDDRHVGHCIIDATNSLPIERHLAYLHILQFFPDAKPNKELV